MGGTGVPKGWHDYRAIGKVIPGTRIIAFKTPLKLENYSKNSDDPKLNRFSPQDCMQAVNRGSSGRHRLGLVLNLTYTTKYYNPADFERGRVHYAAIMCPGHEIPNDELFFHFQRSIRQFYYDYPRGNMVVGVHCTHGINRSGYMITRYLIQCEGWDVEEAIAAVGNARGYPIERANYLAHLRNLHQPSFMFPKIPTEKDLHNKKEASQDETACASKPPGSRDEATSSEIMVSTADKILAKYNMNGTSESGAIVEDGKMNKDIISETKPMIENDTSDNNNTSNIDDIQSKERLRLKRPSSESDFISLSVNERETDNDNVIAKSIEGQNRSNSDNNHIQSTDSLQLDQPTIIRVKPNFKPTIPHGKRRKKS